MTRITPKKKPCACGQHEGYLFSHGYTRECWAKIKGQKQLKRTAIKRTKLKKKFPKKTGELALFQMIWNTRPRLCFVSGEPLGEFDVRLFLHVLPKGPFPKFRLYDKNIVLGTPEVHEIYDKGTEEQLLKYPGGQKLLDLHEELNREYYQK